ncbi:MAG TPA: hypothetical protein VNL73_04485 [Verrucomicrobiae bacterium]|nr:hypothetical protein [Verrucomicrobiae bacterium]
MFKKKKRKVRLPTSKKFSYAPKASILGTTSSSEEPLPDETIELRRPRSNIVKTSTGNPTTEAWTEADEAFGETETVGRTPFDFLWSRKDELMSLLKPSVVLPFLYVVLIFCFGDLKPELNSILMHLGGLVLVYLIVLIAKILKQS